MASRRSRRAQKRRGWIPKALAGLAALLVLAVVIGHSMLRSYLQGESFRELLSREVSKAVGMEGAFSSFQWDGLSVRTDGYRARGDMRIRELDLEGIRTEVGLGGISRGVWELKGSTVGRMVLEMDATATATATRPPAPPAPQTPPAPRRKGWLPSRVEPDSLVVGDCSLTVALKRGRLRLEGSRIDINILKDKAAEFTVRDGNLTVPLALRNLPPFTLGSARGRWRDKLLFLTEATASVGDEGRLTLSGEWDGTAGRSTFEGTTENIRCESFLDTTWAKRVTGSLSGPFSVRIGEGSSSASGSVVMHQGILTALPFLDTLAAYADTRRLRTLHLTEARTDWRWREEELDLTGLTLASDDLIRLEGSLSVRGQALDGSFRLGIAPGTLANIPGAESRVFSPGDRGMLWTPLRIGGTIRKPKEDLSARLIEAAGLRMFEVLPETGQQVLRFSESVLGTTPADVIGKGIGVVEEGAGLIQDVTNAFGLPVPTFPTPPRKDGEQNGD